MRTLTDEEVIAAYGDPRPSINSDGRVNPVWELSILTQFPLPSAIPLAWGGFATKVTCHKLIAGNLRRILNEIYMDRAAWSSINDYGGCYEFRRQRGASTKLSRHCWGIAIDLDTRDNPMGTVGKIHPKIVEIFKRNGWVWGGDFKGQRRDPMHFEVGHV